MKQSFVAKYIAVALASGLTLLASSAKASLIFDYSFGAWDNISQQNVTVSGVLYGLVEGGPSLTGTGNGDWNAPSSMSVTSVTGYTLANPLTISLNGYNTDWLNATVANNQIIAASLQASSQNGAQAGSTIQLNDIGDWNSTRVTLINSGLIYDATGLTIDSISFNGASGGTALGPVTYSLAATSPVPEPSQLAASLLLVAGIAGFVIVKRRKEASEQEALAA